MIGTKGQWQLLLRVGDVDIKPDTLQSLVLIEEAGNILPVLEVVLIVTEPSLFEVINSATKLTAMIAKDITDDVQANFSVVKNTILPTGPHTHEVTIRAILDCQQYLLQQDIKSYIGTASKTITSVLLSQGLTQGIIHNSQDLQVYIQPNITAQNFINLILKTIYLDDTSAFSLGIHADKKFNLINITQQLKETNPDNIMSYLDQGKELHYNRIQPTSNNFGFYSSLASAGKGTYTLDLVTGNHYKKEFTNNPITTSQVSSLDIYPRYNYDIITDNTHSNYHTAKVTQLANLAKVSNLSTFVEFGNQFIDIRLLDSYTVIFPPDDHKAVSFSNETHSGKWIVTKVIRQIQDNKLYTSAEISREGYNTLTK